jgi:hypothetical protein
VYPQQKRMNEAREKQRAEGEREERWKYMQLMGLVNTEFILRFFLNGGWDFIFVTGDF